MENVTAADFGKANGDQPNLEMLIETFKNETVETKKCPKW
jgi:hypothetical protein